MSYDLFFQAGKGKKLDKRAFAAHFRGRRHYKVENGQALYQNEDAGVYFIFDEPDDGVVAFNLNYFRPHVFCLEAAPELEAFAEAFSAGVGDPQGTMEEKFDRDAFLSGWNDGNRFAYKAMLKEQSGPVHTWMSQRIRNVWEWNYARPPEELQDGADIFVPCIFAINRGGQAWAIAIWPPECPILLPEVDGVLVPLAQTGKGTEEVSLVAWDEIEPVVKPYQEESPGLARYRLAFEKWPAEVEAFLNKKRKAAGQMDGIGMDEILDLEIVAEAGGA